MTTPEFLARAVLTLIFIKLIGEGKSDLRDSGGVSWTFSTSNKCVVSLVGPWTCAPSRASVSEAGPFHRGHVPIRNYVILPVSKKKSYCDTDTLSSPRSCVVCVAAS
jgi:hypothetical protein